MDGERHHLRDRRETGDRAEVCWVFPVSALKDEDGAPFEEPVVLLVPPVGNLPLDHLLDQLVHSFLDRWTSLDGEGVDAVYSACLPRGRAPEDLVKFLFRECSPAASSLDLPSDLSEDFLDRLVNSSPIAGILVIDGPPELQCFQGIWSIFITSILIWEGLIPAPEDVKYSVFPLLPLGFTPHLYPGVKLLLSF